MIYNDTNLMKKKIQILLEPGPDFESEDGFT